MEKLRPNQVLAEIKKELQKHTDKQHWGICSTPVEQLRSILQRYQDIARRHLQGAEDFRDQMLVWLRAMSLTLTMTGNAATHAEKGARLRGTIEIIEKLIRNLQNEKFDFSRTYWHSAWDDDFRSDYPVRDLLHENHDLKARLKEAQETIGKLMSAEQQEGE